MLKAIEQRKVLEIHYAGERSVNEMSKSARLCCAARVNNGENRGFAKRNEKMQKGLM